VQKTVPMDNYTVKGTKDKPDIRLNHEIGVLYMGGSSLPENVLEVFNPVIDWIEQYIKAPQPATKVEFFFDYLNTASSHMVVRIFEKIISLKIKCEHLTINWYYPTGDLDMRNFGQELSEIINHPVHLMARHLDS
jgi:hypothetical protein